MLGFLPLSLFVHKVFDLPSLQPHSTSLIALGFVLQGLATGLIGPSYLFRAALPDLTWITLLGLFFSGVGGSFTSIGAYQEILLAVRKGENGQISYDESEVSDVLSGFYNAGLCLGAIVGPLSGSYIMLWTGSFRICCDFFALLTLSFAIIMVVAINCCSSSK
jgi:hypothetical protein